LDIKIIGAALNHARRQGIISTNPAEAVELPKGKSMERGTFTPAEVKMLVDTAEGEWKTLILLAYFHRGAHERLLPDGMGGRGLERGYAHLHAIQDRRKSDHADSHGLAGGVEQAGRDRQAGSFPDATHGQSQIRRTPKGLSETFKRIMRDAGLDAGKVKKAGVRQLSRRTFHALRHSFNSAMANAGVSQEVRMKLTGHKTESVNRGYTHHELEPSPRRREKNPVPWLNLTFVRRTSSNILDTYNVKRYGSP
jgi:hypothetical protein